MSAFARAARALDEVQHPPQLSRFDPDAVLAVAREEVPEPGKTMEELTAHLDGLRDLLGEIDRFAQKSMRIRLTHSPDDLPRELRTLVQTTVLAYEHDLPLLRQRVGAAMARLNGATGATDRLLEAASQVLATRSRLRHGVLELAQGLAAAWLPAAQRRARDRSQPDEERDRWKRAVMDLGHVAARGDTLVAGSLAERLAAIAAPEEPPDEERPDRFSLLELD